MPKGSIAIELLKDFIALSDKEHKIKDLIILFLIATILATNIAWIEAYTNKTNSICELVKEQYNE